ncbi:reverse transcriptase domain-containing protein [Tanacetum coccineum]
MTSGRENSPPLGFSTLTPLLGPNVGELPPIIFSTFTTRSPNNTPLANRASTSANPNPVISPTFVEANYEVLESLLRDHRRHARNKDLCAELDYYNKQYDEEREMKPRDESMAEREPDDMRPSKRIAEEGRSHGGNLPPLLAAHLGRRENLPPNGMYLSYNAPSFIPNSLQSPSNSQMPSYANPYAQPNASMTYNQPLSYPFHAHISNPSFGGVSAYHPYKGYTQQALMSNYGPNHNGPMYPLNTYGPAGLFAYSTSYVTLFVRWIEDYPFSDGLKMPPHVGSYDGKGDPDNYLHLFEGAIRMQKWAMLVACHMFTYTLKDSARIWWNIQKACSIINYEDLKAKFRSHFSQQKKFTKTHLAVHNIKQGDGESTRDFFTRYTNDTLQILGLHKGQRISGFVYELKTRNLVKFLSTDLPAIYKGLMKKTYTWIEAKEVSTNGAPNDHKEGFDKFSKATEKAAKAFEQPPRMVGNKRSRDMSKYYHFHEDHGHETKQCWELRHQIEEAVKSGHLTYLVKGIKKGKAKASDT